MKRSNTPHYISSFFFGGTALLFTYGFLTSLATRQEHSVLARMGILLATLAICLPVARVSWRSARRISVRNAEIEENERKEKARKAAVKDGGNELIMTTYVGGSGLDIKPGSVLFFKCEDDCLRFEGTGLAFIARFTDLTSLELSGPGTVTTNAGLVGGGFGISGALKGMLEAAVINKLTEKSSTNTFLRVLTANAELYLHTTEIGLHQLRLVLSKAFVKLESDKKSGKLAPASVSAEIGQLHSLLKAGAITDDEFARAKRKLLSDEVTQ